MNATDRIAEALHAELNAVSVILKQTPYEWREINGALNILNNKNRAHYQKIKRKLFLDFRMIEDHQIQIAGLNSHLEYAYELASQLQELASF